MSTPPTLLKGYSTLYLFTPRCMPLLAFSALTLLIGRHEGHLAGKKYEDGGGRHWLVRMQWRPAGWSVCLPLLISPCTIKSRSSLLARAHPGGPGKRAMKRLWCGHTTECSQVLFNLQDQYQSGNAISHGGVVVMALDSRLKVVGSTPRHSAFS